MNDSPDSGGVSSYSKMDSASSSAKRSPWRDIIMPRYLGRLGYFLRMLPLEAIILMTFATIEDAVPEKETILWPFAGCIAATLYLVFFVMRPRARDIGWHPASIAIGLIPVVGGMYGLALLFKRGTGRIA